MTDKKACTHCKTEKWLTEYMETTSPMFPDGFIEICYDCLTKMVHIDSTQWNDLDRICQYANIPFHPNEWLRIYDDSHQDVKESLKQYNELYWKFRAKKINWQTLNVKWIDYMKLNMMEGEIDDLRDDKIEELQVKWMGEYDWNELLWLERYYQEMCQSFEINTAAQRDYLRKICKLSLTLDKELAHGAPNSQLFSSYDKLMNSANFTAAANKQTNAITSISELVDWIERNGYQPHFYDGVDRDIVDLTMRDMQSYTRRLVMGEPGLKEMVEHKANLLLESTPVAETVVDWEDDEDNMATLQENQKKDAKYRVTEQVGDALYVRDEQEADALLTGSIVVDEDEIAIGNDPTLTEAEQEFFREARHVVKIAKHDERLDMMIIVPGTDGMDDEGI